MHAPKTPDRWIRAAYLPAAASIRTRMTLHSYHDAHEAQNVYQICFSRYASTSDPRMLD